MQSAISLKTHIRTLIIISLLYSNSNSHSQNIHLPNAYAHNDYWHKRPLLDALANGYSHIEADIYLRKGNLIVTHIFPFLRKKRTLEKLYLKPLVNYITAKDKDRNLDYTYPITLMVDIKSDADKTYKALQPLLEKYKSVLSRYENGKVVLRQVTIVLSGHKPYDAIKDEESRLVFIDEDLRKVNKDSAHIDMYPIASCKYSSLINWKGKGAISNADRRRLCAYVLKAHEHGKKVRLWASPENKAVWKELLKCGVDLINTDRLTALKNFLISDLAVFAEAE